ncbi:MAG: class I SAM-dependent methyltransferase [Planctomycetaceae bacterium]|nr:class I SAM-dependent methyltransferase [Planctomycetaceae bacterium]
MSRSPTIDLTHPYMEELLRHRRMWEKKPAVRKMYRRWYAMIVQRLCPAGPTVELGCGCGNFKEYYPQALATDSFATPWCDRTADACNLPFDAASVGNLVLFDVLHHLGVPTAFFEQACRVLAPGGRVVIIEPAVGWFSRLIYRYCHHEPVDAGADPLCTVPPPRAPADFANTIAATILFDRRLDEFAARFPALRVVERRWFSSLSYPMIGGFRRFCLLPAWAVAPAAAAEDFLIQRLGLKGLAMRMLVVLEKSP